ncbi:MAG: hypothetical protein IIZ36_01440 [Ruminococcus sp.]|nr:hypothetical protein [Ruminococcus sp.]
MYTDETGCWILESWYPVEEENYSAEFEAYYAAEDFRPSSYSLSLKDNIAINFKVKPETIEGYSYPFLFVNYQQKWYQVYGYETLDDGTLVFEFDKILPQCYRDSATAYLCAEKDGKMYCGGGYEKRVSDYLINMQGKYSNKLDGLIVNLLRYIAETQKYTGYDTDYLATNYIRTQSVPYAKKTLAPMEDVKNYHAQYCDGTIRAEFKSATLSLGSAVGIKVTFTADYSDDLLIKVDCNGESRYYWAYEFERTDNGKISFTYNLFANQMHDTVSFTICDGWDYTPVSDTMTYSAATYASKYINDPTIGSLLKELMLYGQASESYAQDS